MTHKKLKASAMSYCTLLVHGGGMAR